MKYEVGINNIVSRYPLNGSGNAIIFQASLIRSERTGIHAAISILQNTTRLAYDTFNIGRDEERNKLVRSAHKGLGKAEAATCPLEILKHEMDSFCYGLWDEWQEREPAVEIWTNKEDTPIPPKWLLEPFIIADQPNVLFGERSAMKSLTALVFSAVMSLQWEENPFRLKAPTNYTETLYLDFERNKSTTEYNLTRLQRGMDLPSLPIHYKRIYGPLSRNAEWVKKYLLAHPKIALTIIDSITPAAGGNLNDTGPASEFFEAERYLQTTTLCIAHASNKDPEQKHKTVIGTFAYEAYAGNVWECRKSQDEESSTADICMYHRKPPAVYRVRKPIGYRITFHEDDHALLTSYLNPDSIPDFVERMSNSSRILDAVKHENLTELEMSKNLDMPMGTVHVTAYRLYKKGFLVVTGKSGKSNVYGRGSTVTAE